MYIIFIWSFSPYAFLFPFHYIFLKPTSKLKKLKSMWIYILMEGFMKSGTLMEALKDRKQ